MADESSSNQVSNVSSNSSSLPSGWIATLRNTFVITSFNESLEPCSNKFKHACNNVKDTMKCYIKHTHTHTFSNC